MPTAPPSRHRYGKHIPAQPDYRMATASQTKRVSESARAVPPQAKPPCKIDKDAIISDKAIIVGTYPVTIGARTVIHPYTKLDSSHAAIELGQCCIVAERATVGLSMLVPGVTSMVVEDYVNVETGATVEASNVGKGTSIAAFSIVETKCKLGKFCKVPPSTTLHSGEMLEDYTVYLPNGQRRTDTTTAQRPDIQELKLKGQIMHINTLKRLVPSNIAKWA